MFGLGGKFNLGALMQGAKQIQEMIEKSQEELAKIEVTGESGAGLVKVTMTAQHTVKNIWLADELLKESKEIIEDLITAAINNATQKATGIARTKMTDMGQLLGNMTDQKEEG